NFYAERRRYWPARCMYASVISVIDELADLGLFEHERMPPGNLGWQSRFRATAELIRMFTDQPPLRLTCDRRERIILRDSKGRPLGYDDTEATHRMRGRLTTLNEALTSIVVALDGEVIAEGAPLTTTQNRIGAATLTLHRAFNESFQLGGRFYGMWPQNIPKELRRKITIDGSPTSEPDFPEHHLRLLYARCEQDMPTAPFEIDGWPRKVVKIATYTLINASTPTSALRAIAFDLTGPGAYDEARRLISAIEAKHSAIAHAWRCSAALMRTFYTRESDTGYDLCEQALQIDPENVRALSWLSFKFSQRVGTLASSDRQADLHRADELASLAIKIDPDFHLGHTTKGDVLLLEGRYRQAIDPYQIALMLAPSTIQPGLAMAYNYLGESEQAISYADKEMRLSPQDRFLVNLYNAKAMAFGILQNYEEALLWLQRAEAAVPDNPLNGFARAGVLAMAGREADARATMQRYLASKNAP